MAKIALLIGVSEYEPGLDGLPSAVNDAIALRQVLTNPEMGEFAEADVTVLQNPDRQTMETAIYNLFANRQKDDLVLLYFSGHGVVDDGGEFYFASRSTRKEEGRLVPPTAVSARPVQGWMEQSRSQRKVIILDSCFSGAFAKGVKAKDSGSVNPEQFLGGKGTAILTASTSTQYALTQEGFDLSVYTHYLVEGIRTGGADRDDDGWIAMEELHEYASSKVREAAPAMTPEFYPVKDGYKILLAKSPKDDPKLRYRKEVKLLAEEDEGEFSFINRHYLDELRQKRGLSLEDAAEIEAEELEPYRLRQAKVERYRTVFAGAIAHRYPLTDRDRLGLQRLQQLLSLRDEDVAAIETPILALRQAEYERQRAELKQQQNQQEAARQRQADLLAAAAEQQRQWKIAEQRRQSSKILDGIQTQQFEFETASVILKKGGLFGGKTTVEISRGSSRAQFFAENLGNGVTLDMVAIPGGEFLMGTAEADRETIIQERTRHGASKENAEKWTGWELPQHRVKLPSFYMGKFAITQAQWSQVAGLPKINRDLNPDPAEFKGAKRPIEKVSWDEATEFCDRLSRKAGKLYRLPSEAEWEYACRAGTTTPFHFGATITSDLANCDFNYPYGDTPKGKYREQTSEVGSFPANAFGLFDMHGNVWEWCADRWHENYQGAPIDGSAWEMGGDASCRTLRGGSWVDGPVDCRSAVRGRFAPVKLDRGLGFRVVCASA